MDRNALYSKFRLLPSVHDEELTGDNITKHWKGVRALEYYIGGIITGLAIACIVENL